MPKWGLTAPMRRTKPWGLEEKWLQPGKVFTDPVHGDIFLTELEVQLVDSPPFQRLRRVRQLGTTHLVYPGATHTRFAHSLGALKVAQDLIDVVVEQRSGREFVPDLFTQWEAELGHRAADGHHELDEAAAREFDKRVAEVTILARLGALLHDFCHVPFGHSIEDELKLLTPHDKNEDRFKRLWEQVPQAVRTTIAQAQGLEPSLKRLILSKVDGLPKLEWPFVEDLVGNTICADLLDYLRRDHMFAGLPLALGRRFEAGFYVLPDGDPLYGRHMVLRVHRKGQERPDAITEVLKHLRYRYELSERALVHHTKLAADAMIGKALEMWWDALWVESASDKLAGDDASAPLWPAGLDPEELRSALTAADFRGEAIDRKVRKELDTEMTRRGDDGLLEYLSDLPAAHREHARHRDLGRRRAVSALAQALQDRALYRRIARQPHTRIDRAKFYRDHGSPKARRKIELDAARFAGIDPAWHLVVWLPPPDMRLKVAGVVVDDGKEIRRFKDREDEGKQRGADIYKAHQNLWDVSVFAHRTVAADDVRRKRALASLAADLDLMLGGLEDELGPHPHEWPDRMVLDALEKQIDRVFEEAEIEDLIALRHQKIRAARQEGAGRPTFEALLEEYKNLLD